MENYKYTILRHVDGVYALTGYCYVNGKWSMDGASLHFKSLDALLESIRQGEKSASERTDK